MTEHFSLKAFDKVYHITSTRQNAIAVYTEIYQNVNTERKQQQTCQDNVNKYAENLQPTRETSYTANIPYEGQKRYLITGLGRPLGLQEVKAPRISGQSAHEFHKMGR